MQMNTIRVGRTGVALIASLIVVQTCQAAEDCDRICLSGIAKLYIKALPKHDIKSLPLAESVRITENGVDIVPGGGMWSTGGAIERSRVALDPETGSIAIQAGLHNEGQPTVLLTRLKVRSHRIVEIESVVAEKGKLFDGEGKRNAREAVHFNYDTFLSHAQPEWEENQPIGKHRTRAQLIETAGTYFVGLRSLGTKDFKNAAFSARCDRFENGLQVTNVDFSGHPPTSCTDQFIGLNAMMAGPGTGVSIESVRTPVVDVEKGIVLSIAIMAGRSLIADMFKVEGDQIRTVQITYKQLPQGSGTGWN
jgi:hypothetical protein